MRLLYILGSHQTIYLLKISCSINNNNKDSNNSNNENINDLKGINCNITNNDNNKSFSNDNSDMIEVMFYSYKFF